jgi:Cof subfamily protein (haloacid dehalogenase superfamily)
MSKMKKECRVVFTDLDGTLLGSDQKLSNSNRQMLEDLGQQNIARVVITGRSLLSCNRVINQNFPIDFLVTSSGAGIFSHQPRELIHHFGLALPEIKTAIDVLKNLKMDFMVHDPVPDNHQFYWYRFGSRNPDFDRRLALYAGHHQKLTNLTQLKEGSAQLLSIETSKNASARLQELREKLSAYSVLRATSPLDHASTWYEIFPPNVSKSQAAEWICRTFDFDSETALAIGNDFNDIDMLRWAAFARVVANAPSPLTEEFLTVADHDKNGFSEAVAYWLGQTNK